MKSLRRSKKQNATEGRGSALDRLQDLREGKRKRDFDFDKE